MKRPKLLAGLVVCSIGFLGLTQAQQTDPPPEAQVQTGARMVIASAEDDGNGPKFSYFSTSTDGVMGDFVMLGDGSMSGMPAPDIFSLANNRGVQDEIELVDDQLKQIKEINKKFSQQISEQLGDLSKGGINQQRGMDIKALIDRLQSEKKQQMQEVLLPHQFDRLRQIALQTHMRQSGEVAALSSKRVAEELGIDEDQKKRLEERAKEIKAKMDEKIKKLKEQAKQDLLDELSSKQREKLNELTGEAFELKRENCDRLQKRRSECSKEKQDN